MIESGVLTYTVFTPRWMTSGYTRIVSAGNPLLRAELVWNRKGFTPRGH
jgi:hypothetical protein